MQDDLTWFQEFQNSPEYTFMKTRPVAYFCAEFALSDNLPIYAGGLGILAGDIVREAADQKLPFIAVGLLYHEGYQSKDLYPSGIMVKNGGRINPQHAGLFPLVDSGNKRVMISVPIQETLVYAQAWYLKMNTVTVYLLDTNVPENSEEDRRITDQLYAHDKETRFKQEIVLGLGGLRMLDALSIFPIGYHLNEGHSALLALEEARYEMSRHVKPFQEELENTKQHIFFTNHTLVAGGNDTYSAELAATLLSGFATELQVPVSDLVKLGEIEDSQIFSMTLLALRMAGKVNAVSELHAKKAAEIWKEYKMTPITNGIHLRTWDKIGSKEGIWENHRKNKQELLSFIYATSSVEFPEDVLLLGWARRIVGYKRPLALFENLKRFQVLSKSSGKEIKVVISGLSHASDPEGGKILEDIQEIMKSCQGTVVYLPDYHMESAKLLVSGCDVWLNTPVVGFEACGTSGMKAALNGVLPFSTADGWVAEAQLQGVGWNLQNDNLSENILDILEQDIVPLYYGNRAEWVKMMQNARDMAINQFNATHMLKKYMEEFYLPLIREHENK